MAKKSKLKTALDVHRGRDYDAEKQKKQMKAAEKRKRQREVDTQKNGHEDLERVAASSKVSAPSAENSKDPTDDAFEACSEDEDQDDEAMNGVSLLTSQTKIEPATIKPSKSDAPHFEEEEEEEEDESDVPLSDLEDEDMEDTIPHQRLTINNGPALIASCNSISIIKSRNTPFHHHNSLISTLPSTASAIPDPNDDVNRELEFYRIARDAAIEARSLLKKEKIPFTRPNDYFAEMVKSDEHMGKVKQKLYNEAAGKKAAEEARKLRDAKKFGKAVQVEKEQLRAKEKRETLEKIKELKRKRRGNDTGKVNEGEGGGDDDLFEKIDVETSMKKNDRRDGPRSSGGPNLKRQKRDAKFGYGGKKRFSKSGDAVSSANMSSFSARGMKEAGGARGKSTSKRLGKSRRAATR